MQVATLNQPLSKESTEGLSGEAWTQSVIAQLNDSLATELVCMLRYRRHHYTAHGMASAKIGDEFLVHSEEEAGHADRIASRIVQLGGEPDFNPETLLHRSHADYNDASDLKAMIQANLTAEQGAIENYTQLIRFVGDRDPSTRRLLEDILAVEQQHAEELESWITE
jgi:bacterioferritin